MVTVLMMATAVGPAGVYFQGHTYDVSEAEAAAWVEGGYAVSVRPVAPETAERVTAELAVLRRPRRAPAKTGTEGAA